MVCAHTASALQSQGAGRREKQPAGPTGRASVPTWMPLGRLLLSMRLAVLTVSPKRQKRGILDPTCSGGGQAAQVEVPELAFA